MRTQITQTQSYKDIFDENDVFYGTNIKLVCN